jgi:hypothetical protein
MWGNRRFNKFGSSKIKDSGRTYHSKLELAVNNILELRERAKEIRILKRQQHIHFYFEDEKLCEYWPDFTCIDLKTDEVFFVEAKGYETPEWLIKLKLWRAGGPGKLEIWRGSHGNPRITEIVIPKHEFGLARREQIFGKL